MPSPDPLAFSAAVYRAAGRDVALDTSWTEQRLAHGPEQCHSDKPVWLIRDGHDTARRVRDLTRPENLGELVGLVAAVVRQDERNCFQLRYGGLDGPWWVGQVSLESGGVVKGDSPGVALALAFLDAAGVDRPEGW